MPTAYFGGPYIQASFDNMLSANVIGPLNIPFSRTTDALDNVINLLYTNFVPWEIWIDYLGNVHMGVEKGSDKTSNIVLEAGYRLNKVSAERTTKQTIQRIKITGQGESKTQDDVTSDWKEELDVMAEINSFYEKVQSDREISVKAISDIRAQMLVTVLAPIREQITLPDVDFSPYTANDVDVGDYVTATDPVSGLSGSYRIKTIEKTVESNGGETVNITVTKVKTDISNRLASLQKRLDIIQSSNTALSKLLDLGGKQGNINPDKVGNVWQITSSNKFAFEVPEESTEAAADDNMTFVEAAGGGTYACNKDEFYIQTDTAGADDLRLFNIIRDLNFEDDCRFSCELEFDSDEGDLWQAGDEFLIGIFNTALNRGFAFRFRKAVTAGFDVEIVLGDGVVALQYVDVTAITGTLGYNERYRLEGRLDWDEMIVRFYFGSANREFSIIGIFPISLTASATGQLLHPLYIRMVEGGAHANDIMAVIYNWRSQAKASYVS